MTLEPQVMTRDCNQNNPMQCSYRAPTGPVQTDPHAVCILAGLLDTVQHTGMPWPGEPGWMCGMPLACATRGLTCGRDAVQHEAGCLLVATELCKVHAGQLTTL